MNDHCEILKVIRNNRYLDLGNGSNKFRNHYCKRWTTPADFCFTCFFCAIYLCIWFYQTNIILCFWCTDGNVSPKITLILPQISRNRRNRATHLRKKYIQKTFSDQDLNIFLSLELYHVTVNSVAACKVRFQLNLIYLSLLLLKVTVLIKHARLVMQLIAVSCKI